MQEKELHQASLTETDLREGCDRTIIDMANILLSFIYIDFCFPQSEKGGRIFRVPPAGTNAD
jgi:hypothetical protein